MMVAAVGRRLAEATTVDASAAAATSTVAVAMSMAAVARAAAKGARLARCSQRVRW